MPEIFFNGPAGRIEARYVQSRDIEAPVALVLHPNPQYGGTMNNKVVYQAYKVLAENGFTVLRMNFRGVGRSQGEFDNGHGELIDAATALDWLQVHNQRSLNCWVVGFSFGAWVGMQLIMRRPEINNFIAIAPPVTKFDFSFLYPSPIPGLVIHGDNDSVVLESAISNVIEKLNKPKQDSVKYKVIEGADHFFRNHIDELGKAIDQYVKFKMQIIPDNGFDTKKPKKILLH
jgi:alpha/beta superfamily hydrolase